MVTITATTENEWQIEELKRRQDMFEAWFAYREDNEGRCYAFISEGDWTPPCNCRLVGVGDTLRELKREVRKWYKSIKVR